MVYNRMAKIEPWEMVVTDLEGDGLYYQATTIHCGVCIDVVTKEVKEFPPNRIQEYIDFLEGRIKIGHNLLDFDLPLLYRMYGLKYAVEEVCDTLVLSRLLFPERPGGHSLGAWGTLLGEPKIDWRAKAEQLGLCDSTDPKGSEFRIYHPEMLVYNRQDCVVNLKVIKAILKHLKWDWEDLRDNLKEVQLYG